jgi:predicted  nucleic acid-binding Zn-ribbon protein
MEKNLSQFIKLLTEQYIDKQEKVRKEIENKQRYLSDFQQTQLNENKQLSEKFQKIQKQFQILTEQYQQVKFILSFF